MTSPAATPGSADAERASRLRSAVESATARLLVIDEEASALPPAPGKWSARELVGHLIDSASNNHQRFVRAASVDHLEFDGYDQDEWVTAQEYGHAPWPELVTLFRLFNLHLARVMETTPRETLELERRRHSLDRIAFRPRSPAEPVTLGWFMDDYVDHLEHHLGVLFGDGPQS